MPYESASRREMLLLAGALPAAGSQMSSTASGSGLADRAYFVSVLDRVARPVLTALSQRNLKKTMPVETAPGADIAERRRYTHLEALGRLLAGIAPWLESGTSDEAENRLREEYAQLARRSIAAAVDPASPDRMNFTMGAQPVVDAAFLALAVLRAPTELWKKLDGTTRQQLLQALQSTRVIRPGFNNWLLFSATVEAFLGWAGATPDDMRIDYAVRQHEQWYKGDGVYGDGPQFHCDYYNSFVIHPLLLQVVETASARSNAWKPMQPAVVSRAQRYAAIQERVIGPDGSFTPVGRSLAYRCGAFHLLADMALRSMLPETLPPGQVRCALTAVSGEPWTRRRLSTHRAG